MFNKIVFREEQRLRQWWLWLIILGPIGFNLYFIITPNFSTSPFSSGNFSFSLIAPLKFWILLLFSILVLWLLFFMKMTTQISANHISIRHMYLIKKNFEWKEIASAEVIKYSFIGFGKRYSFKYGIVYNMSGNSGLALTLKNGKKYLLGTQKPEELKRVIALIKQ